jgi:signal transduction histidine kinase
MSRTPWIFQGEYCGVPLQVWCGSSVGRRHLSALREDLGPEARIQPVEGSDGEGPAVVLLDLEDIQGPHRDALMEACTRALPGRPVICGGSRQRDALMEAINTWHAFRVLPRDSATAMVATVVRQAHEALTLEVTAVRTAEKLRKKCHQLQRSMEELEGARQQLVRSERLATVSKISRVLVPLLQRQARNLDDLEGSLTALGDATLGTLLSDAIERARSISGLVEEMLALSSTDGGHGEEDLDALVERAGGMLRHEPELRQRTLHVSCDSGARVRVDRRGMSLALMNLMRDAVREADAYSMIQVRTSRHAEQAVVEINLGGQAHAHDAAELDLPVRLSKLAVEGHGGSLHCRNSPGAGKQYRVLLPLVD